MSYGKGGGVQLGNGGSSTDTSQYGMNNNQYNQSYPNTAVPQPVTSREFGQGSVQQPTTGMQFNQPSNQGSQTNVNNYGGNWGKGGGSQPAGNAPAGGAVGKPGMGSIPGPIPGIQPVLSHDMWRGNPVDATSGPGSPGLIAPNGPDQSMIQPGAHASEAPQDQYNQYASQVFGNSPAAGELYTPNFQNANPEAPSDNLQQQSYNQISNMLFNPQPTLGSYVSPGSVAQAQLSTPGVYSAAQANSGITY